MPVTIRARRRRHRLFAPLAAGVCVLAIAGCGSSGHKPSASSHASAQLAFSEGMRRHGVTGFPDPTTTPPTNPQNYSIAEGIAGNVFLLVPSTINNSPAFVHAATACDFH